tara:strand:- start:1851 stop:2105 length:255 start_codon:yes stop_codon:yes gene_type:complete
MNALELKIDSLQNQIRTLVANQRQDVRKKICSAKEAMYILDMSRREFYEHIKLPVCKVRVSSKKGKYVLSSVYEEADRLNYEDK